MIRLTRKLEFSAAHFYHNPDWSADENRRVFGNVIIRTVTGTITFWKSPSPANRIRKPAWFST